MDREDSVCRVVCAEVDLLHADGLAALRENVSIVAIRAHHVVRVLPTVVLWGLRLTVVNILQANVVVG